MSLALPPPSSLCLLSTPNESIPRGATGGYTCCGRRTGGWIGTGGSGWSKSLRPLRLGRDRRGLLKVGDELESWLRLGCCWKVTVGGASIGSGGGGEVWGGLGRSRIRTWLAFSLAMISQGLKKRYNTRQVLSVIPSARSIITPTAIITFT